MSIRTKSLTILVITALLLLIGLYAITELLLNRNTRAEEADMSTRNIQRALDALDSKKATMKALTIDWAFWDDAYDFIGNSNKKFIERNLDHIAIANLGINLIMFIDNEGRLIYSEAIDLSTKEQIDIPKGILKYTGKYGRLLYHPNQEASYSGLFALPEGPMLVTYSAVLKSDRTGPSNGTLVFGKFLDSKELASISTLTGFSVRCESLANPPLSPDFLKAWINFKSGRETHVAPLDNNRIAGYTILRDIPGDPAIILRVVSDRAFYNRDIRNNRFFFLAVLFFSIILFAVSTILLQKLVISRLEKLSSFMHETSATRELDKRIDLPGRDEIALLATSTNNMLEKIQDMNLELTYLSYYDKPTGLYNRTYFERELKKAEAITDSPYSLLMGDINGLKLTNDTFGHQEGDKLLRIIAEILRKECGEGNIICRWGGDEFAAILYNCDETASVEIRNNIKKSCDTYSGFFIKPSIALGAATREGSEDINLILREAEERMYRNKLLESNSARNSIITSLEQTLSERSYETEEHTRRIKDMCSRLGAVIGLPDNKLDELILLATLHDIGKIGIPDSILMKPEALTDKEWTIMKRHSEIGYRIALTTPELIPIADGILAHHERFDGTGYPKGLKGAEIPIMARILTIVDSYDVMTNHRPYKEAITNFEAIKELQRCAGTQFDPDIVNIFIEMICGKL